MVFIEDDILHVLADSVPGGGGGDGGHDGSVPGCCVPPESAGVGPAIRSEPELHPALTQLASATAARMLWSLHILVVPLRQAPSQF